MTGQLQFVRESHVDSRVEPAHESVGGAKKLYLHGVFAQADLVNKNKRCYPRDLMSRVVENYVTDYVSRNRAVGELEHPERTTPNPERVSQKILSLAMEGSNVIGKSLVIESMPCGKIVKCLVEAGVDMGVSTRGRGAWDKTGTMLRFNMSAIDNVFNPSAPDAFVRGAMESVEMLVAEGFADQAALIEAWKTGKVNDTAAMKKAAFAEILQRLSQTQKAAQRR